ncbi:MAG: protein kinase [Fuerstiella sp.]|nr:protein kinase [Fuerstiella sp.]
MRLTLFSAETSALTGFRAAFRKDQTTLSEAPHDNLPEMLFWGENRGQLFFVTEMLTGISLSQRIEADDALLWDELADVGWQIASTLQHAHNRGLTHGALTLSAVYVSADVRVVVADLGVHRWLASSEDSVSFVEYATKDLRDFGRLLKAAVQRAVDCGKVSATTEQMRAMDELIADLETGSSTVSPRDVQGRLGRMLLDVAGDSIEMVDARDGQQLARRSIVDELFDDESTVQERASGRDRDTSTPARRTWGVVVLVIIASLMAMIAFTAL